MSQATSAAKQVIQNFDAQMEVVIGKKRTSTTK